jgi:hypothetical protein
MLKAHREQPYSEELVPLAVACRVAYHQVTHPQTCTTTPESDLVRIVPQVAAALSALASIHRRVNGRAARPLTGVEVEALLFQPAYENPQPDFRGCYIRRSDLHSAIEQLRNARAAFSSGSP